MRGAVLALALACAPRPAWSVGNPGVTAVPSLQIPMGSRAMGMGAAFTAVASDISALYYNPAGLSRLNADEASASYMTGLADNTLQDFGVGGPLPFAGVTGNGYAGWGASLLWARNGTIDVNRTNPDGSFLSSQSLNAGDDVVATLGYAERVASTPLDLGDGRTLAFNHFLGISGKYIHSSLVQQYSAQTAAVDAGYLANLPDLGLSAGFSALNIGSGLKYMDVADPLPTMFRGGLAYQRGVSTDQQLTLAADTYYLLHERQWHVDAGLEYFMLQTFGVRLGYQFLQDSAGLTAGFGFRWHEQFLLDYAWTMSNGLADEHRFTITYRFGGVAAAARARGRQPYIDMESMPDEEHLRQGLDEKTPGVDSVPAPAPAPPASSLAPGWIY